MNFRGLRSFGQDARRPPDPPIRAELFSIERLEQHAESLAKAQRVDPRRRAGRPLAPRLYRNTQVLTQAYRAIVRSARAGQAISPAAEWLLDNFHVVDEQIREIKDDLPPGFYRLLPKLVDGPLEGYPRVFGIAWAIVAHSDSAFDIERLTRFVEAYQRVQPLSIGELWALAITLRITLVENLRRLAEAIAERLDAARRADALAHRILSREQSDSEAAIRQSLEQTPWSTAFAVHLAERLRDCDSRTTPAVRWLNERLAADGATSDALIRDEVQRQSAMNVTVRNIITSMRLVSMVNWPEFFESVSPVDRELRAGSDFAAMDFQTRDLYRRAIEELARGSGREEREVARVALAAARRASDAPVEIDGGPPRERDPGYYLIGHGRRRFEREIGFRVPMRTQIQRFHSRLGVISYVSQIAAVTAVTLAVALLLAWAAGAGGWSLLILAVAGLAPASDVGVSLVNRIVTAQVGARLLPAMEFKDGVPGPLKSIVVVPTLLTSVADIGEQIERLEVHHLSNPDENFVFALLSDWKDSPSERAENDDVLLEEALKGIERLNERYGSAGGRARFFLLHRRRIWNKGEEKWIGWERKRGKLHELNRLLRGAADTTFLPLGGRPPADIRYVITLDADTRMPIGAARRLVGKMAHPLNQPRFDPAQGRVVAGHAILQPRITPSLPVGSEGSLFQRVFSGPNGLDPYALAVSDVYQDLFEEGSYCGKGIYHIDAFEAALRGRIPENRVLSHDLLEGIFARAGLVSDIEFVEEFPSRYDVAAARQHRWTRGDWQLLSWIFGRGAKPRDNVARTPIPLMGRWKLFDNLRRSLSAPAGLLSMLIAWLLPLEPAAVWTGFILFTIVAPPLLPAVASLAPPRAGVSLRSHIRSMGRDFMLGLVQSAFLVTFLAHQAWLMVDAVTRTLCRLFIHRRRLLEWVTAAQASDDSSFDRRALASQIAASFAFAVCVGLAIWLAGRSTWPIAAPFAALWVLSPLAARWASMPAPPDAHLSMPAEDARALRLIGRRTWSFFEEFVTASDNMLPPDNFQESPRPTLARRTSPTNIGLYLLSVATARDFGWLGALSAVERLEATFETLQTLERFRGHFYNWYDTRNLRPLEPRYISSVDSGNLAGHLIALANACAQIAAGPALNPSWLQAIEDNFALLRESLPRRAGDAAAGASSLERSIEAFAALLKDPPIGPYHVARRLVDFELQADEILGAAKSEGCDAQALGWCEALRGCVSSHRRDLEAMMPWTNGALAGLDAELAALLDAVPSCEGLSGRCDAALLRIGQLRDGGATGPELEALTHALERARSTGERLRGRLRAIADQARGLAMAMEFGFLFDPDRQLLAIGYRGQDGALDTSFYDLLASEARLASFFAVAKGDVPAQHWFRLGRAMTAIEGGSGLISWSGSMFEYLMPSLVMRAPSGSLIERTNRLIVRRQEDYGHELGVPWGISESAFNARDMEQTYQYSSFGVPDLGYKRGLSQDVVIAPYASALAAMIDPVAAARNFERLSLLGARGAYGWYEAVDYTRTRVPEGAKYAIVRAYMAHHQAMSLVAIGNALNDGAMRARFHAEPMVQAAELLLQERMPRDVALARPPPEQVSPSVREATLEPEIQRRYDSPHSRAPRTHVLSNGRYSVMLTAAGSGNSRWRDVSITRWREDVTRDCWGSYIFLRDVKSGEIWSAGYQPCGVEPDSYEVTFSEDRAEIVRHDGSICTTLEVMVSPEDDAEVRRVSIANHGARAREFEVTSYAELALARQADDIAHPAFAKLFVQSEFAASEGAILATRRRRSSADPAVWVAHLATTEGDGAEQVQFETDRARFLGRGQTIREPAAIVDGWPLSNSAGAVLDPIFSLRRRLRIGRGATARIAFWTMAAATREEALELVDRHRDPQAFDRASTLAWTLAQMQLRHLGVGADEANLFQRLANHLVYPDPALRAPSEAIARGLKKVSALWPHGVSGDLPIVLLSVREEDDLKLARQLLRAHEYWRLKLIGVDLVILNERATSYVQDLQTALEAMVRMNQSLPRLTSAEARGNIFVLRGDLLAAEDRALLQAAARVTLNGGGGPLAEQINRARERKAAVPPPPRKIPARETPEPALPKPAMEFYNGFGGFVEDGREYLIVLETNQRTPEPWINVVANRDFGFHVSADGSGHVWSVNSQQNHLTPWSNDAVSDPPGEAIYIRDDETGEFWTPTALPIRERAAAYTVRHGQGYSRFEHVSRGVALDLVQFVPPDDPIKISRLRIANRSGRARRLSATAYVEWALGLDRSLTAPFIVTEMDKQTGALFARNPWSEQYGGRVAFADLNGKQTRWTCDRGEFIGRDGGLDYPAALASAAALAGRSGGGLDPCAVLQTPIRLGVAGDVEVVFFLGQAGSADEARALVEKYRAADLDAVFRAATGVWDRICETIAIKTPDRSLDILVNRWLPYQTLACRMWARAAFYQASGAYGFRDQLQDSMALCALSPDIAREHLLRAAARQFAEGDVQHWWLPESGRGIRTRISDDRCWLVHAAAHYVRTTGDFAALDEPVDFLEGPPLGEGEHDAFFRPNLSGKPAALYEHCALALDSSLAVGPHGVPLIGAGDWNDGMDRLGEHGKGESVWLGWFLCSALDSFSGVAEMRGEADRAAAWRSASASLKAALEREAWDGDWYRRAYFDDGTPLGSVLNSECRIDSIAQSWAVIAGADPARAARAMEAVDKYLLRRDDKLSLLFWPPFDNTARDPGYIKGYPPGVRENGGQYSHASAWAALAFAMLGDGDRAYELLSTINPVRHADDPHGAHRYRVEPYVVCADVYSTPPHIGRGGWTWYTGSAGWMHRVVLEAILGLHLQGDRLFIDPCVPRHWPGFEIVYRHRSARYEITVENPLGVNRGILAAKFDGRMQSGEEKSRISLTDDGKTHQLQIILG
ncbi:MAG TPA: glucoamylase family protein [Rhizomicrobium sp.]|nr:glucoamylase family protein [Rhizomicrobium sp.]